MQFLPEILEGAFMVRFEGKKCFLKQSKAHISVPSISGLPQFAWLLPNGRSNQILCALSYLPHLSHVRFGKDVECALGLSNSTLDAGA